jgi:uncharacterized DUF497 family protein
VESFLKASLIVVEDQPHSHHELRVHALGVTHSGGRRHVTLALRAQGYRIRVISARKIAAHKRDVPYPSLIKIWRAEKVDAPDA